MADGVSGIQRLPQELQDAIIDLLKNDRLTLRACSLAWRPWLDRCRIHIHHQLYLPGLTEKDLGRRSSEHTIEHVRKLVTNPPEDACVPYPIHLSSPAPALARLRAVVELRLSGAMIADVQSDDREKWAATLPSLKTLAVSNCKILDLNSLMVFIAAFPELEVLEFWNFALVCRRSEDEEALQHSNLEVFPCPSPRLARLVFSGDLAAPASVSELALKWLWKAKDFFSADFTFEWSISSCWVALQHLLIALQTVCPT